MRAICTIRSEPHYRRAAFENGLRRVGFKVQTSFSPAGPTDFLVIWNRQGAQEGLADTWEAKGGTVIVCENGYAGVDELNRQLYAIAVHGHNSSGWFPVGTEDRWSGLGIELAPARVGGDYVLICGQRGIGSREMASPLQWDDKMVKRVRAMGHTVKLRRHPGKVAPATTLEQDLVGAKLCLIWSSSSGVKALTSGIPVAYSAPHWICEGAAGFGLAAVEEGVVLDEGSRLAALQRMAHAQWRVAEIESGEPFARILARLGEAKW